MYLFPQWESLARYVLRYLMMRPCMSSFFAVRVENHDKSNLHHVKMLRRGIGALLQGVNVSL